MFTTLAGSCNTLITLCKVNILFFDTFNTKQKCNIYMDVSV